MNLSNCIIYGPGEAWSLWEDSGFSIFNLYSWANGFSVVDTYSCSGGSWSISPNPKGAPVGSAFLVTGLCSGTDADGKAFTLSYSINAYSYYHAGGGGKGGGGAGVRYGVGGGSVTIVQ